MFVRLSVSTRQETNGALGGREKTGGKKGRLHSHAAGLSFQAIG